MQLASGAFGALLRTLSLTQGLYKPTPSPAGPSTYSQPLASDDSPAYNEYPYNSSVSISDDSCSWMPRYNAPPLDDQVFLPFDQAKATVYRYRQQQSVNLGSWYSSLGLRLHIAEAGC